MAFRAKNSDVQGLEEVGGVRRKAHQQNIAVSGKTDEARSQMRPMSVHQQ